MKLKIKDELIDSIISCPLTRKPVHIRFLDIDLYNYYYNHGHANFFEEVLEENIIYFKGIVEPEVVNPLVEFLDENKNEMQ